MTFTEVSMRLPLMSYSSTIRLYSKPYAVGSHVHESCQVSRNGANPAVFWLPLPLNVHYCGGNVGRSVGCVVGVSVGCVVSVDTIAFVFAVMAVAVALNESNEDTGVLECALMMLQINSAKRMMR